jgi:hypothetical protein
MQLQILLGGEPFVAMLQIVREVTGGAPQRNGTRCYGAMFVDLDEASRRSLQRFLASGPLPVIEN